MANHAILSASSSPPLAELPAVGQGCAEHYVGQRQRYTPPRAVERSRACASFELRAGTRPVRCRTRLESPGGLRYYEDAMEDACRRLRGLCDWRCWRNCRADLLLIPVVMVEQRAGLLPLGAGRLWNRRLRSSSRTVSCDIVDYEARNRRRGVRGEQIRQMRLYALGALGDFRRHITTSTPSRMTIYPAAAVQYQRGRR